MNVQFNPQYSLYSTNKSCENSIYNKKSTPNFCGEAGDEFLKQVNEGMGQEGISDFVKKHKSWYGVSSETFQDVLESVLESLSTGEKSIKKRTGELDERTTELDTREQNLNNRNAELDNLENGLNEREGALLPKENELNEREQGLVPKEQELSAKEQELRAKERNLSAKEQELSAEKQDLDARKVSLDELEQNIRNNTRQKETEAIREELRKSVRAELEEEFADQFKRIEQENKKLDQRVRSIDAYEEFKLEKIASGIRTQYKINDPAVKVYENYGEQMVVTSRMLNNHSHVLRNCSDNTIVNLVDAMRDNKGRISAEMLKTTENILKAKTYCYVEDLPAMIKAIKDENGGLDSDKYGYCIALLAMPGTSFYSVLDSMTKKFKLTGNPAEKLKCPEPSFVSPYKILVSYNMLKGRWESSKYWNNMTSGCNQSLNTKLEYLSIEKKKKYIDALEITQYWARYHDCDTGNRTSEAISKVISRLQTD